MTTPRDPDDMASALLDGLLTEDEAAAARRDPAVAARLAELGAVREAMGTPPASPDPGARERALAAALAAYDAGDELTDAVASVGTVGPMSGRRRAAARPAPSRAGTPSSAPGSAHGSARHRWLAAAAIVLVVVGLVGVLARNRGTGGDGSDSAAREVTTDENSTGAGGTGGAADDAEAGGGGEGTATAGEADEIVDLGDVDSSEALADRARSVLAEGFSSPLAGASGGEATQEQGADGDRGVLPASCSDGAEAERLAAAPETVVLRARATLDGKPVDVWVLGAQDEERVVAVDASCAVVVDRPLQN